MKIIAWKTKTKKGWLYHIKRETNGIAEDYNRYASRQGRNLKARRLKKLFPKAKIIRLEYGK